MIISTKNFSFSFYKLVLNVPKALWMSIEKKSDSQRKKSANVTEHFIIFHQMAQAEKETHPNAKVQGS